MEKWKQLVAARAQKRFSQLEAAERVNVGVVTYQRWEAGKSKPQPHHLRQLYVVFGPLLEDNEEAFGQDSEQLSSSSVEESVLSTSFGQHINEPEVFIAAHLAPSLWFLAFKNHQTCTEKQMKIRQCIEEFDAMNTNNQNYHITRREALCSLATLPIMTLGLTSPTSSLPKAQYKTALEHCAASVEACWELRLSSNASDRLLSFQCATKYLSNLQTIAQSSPQDRQEALHLATRYTIIKAFLAWHCTGLAEAIQYGKDAVALSKETGNISLQIIALQSLAWGYCRAKKDKLALLTAQEAEVLLQDNTHFPNAQQLHPYVWGRTYSTLALAQGRNGLSPEISLGKAGVNPEKGAVDVIDFDYTTFLLEAGEAYCYYGDQTKAMEWLEQRVNPETLSPKIVQSGIGRVEAINTMTLSSLKTKNRDMERTIHFWTAGIEGAKALKSEQRFNEAVTNYELMEVVWPDEPRIAELRDYVVHWKE